MASQEEKKERLVVGPMPVGVVNEWVALLKNLDLKDEDAKALRDLIVKAEAFGLETVITIDDFVKYRWRKDPDQRIKFTKILDTISKTRGTLRDAGIDVAKAAAKTMKITAQESRTLESFCVQVTASREIRSFYNSGRELLQRALWDTPTKGEYSLMVENIPGAWTPTGARGYAVPGTVESLTRCIERAKRSSERYAAILANLRRVSKTVHGS